MEKLLFPIHPLQFQRPGPPLYVQLADVLRQHIENGAMPAGQKLPNLNKMAEIFNVARVTVRQAVQILVTEGVLTSRQGRGIHVTDLLPNRIYANLKTSWAALVKRIEGTSVQLLETSDVDTCPLLQTWALPAVPQYHYMRRIHFKDSSPYALIEIYLDKKIFDRAPELFSTTTVIPVMRDLKIPVAMARQNLTIGCAAAEVAQHLGIPCGAPVAFVKRYACDDKGLAIYAASMVYPGDRVCFDIDLTP